MISSLVLSFVVGIQASDKDLFKSANAKTPTSLAQSYIENLPKVGAFVPQNVLRENLRRDFMPRLMATENDRASYELGLDAYEKLVHRGHHILDLSQRVAKGERIRSKEKKELDDVQEETSMDLKFLTGKIQEGEGKSSPVTFQALKLMANSLQSYACAYALTEKTVVNPSEADTKKDCYMPFPGSLAMLDQTIKVPEKISVSLPDEYDKSHLQPEVWMSEHLRRKVWCLSSFGNRAMCDGISSALEMPRSNEISLERDAVAQAANTMQEDPKVEVPEAATPRSLMEGGPEEKKQMSLGDSIRATLQANKKHKLTLLQKQRQVQKDKLNMLAENKDL